MERDIVVFFALAPLVVLRKTSLYLRKSEDCMSCLGFHVFQLIVAQTYITVSLFPDGFSYSHKNYKITPQPTREIKQNPYLVAKLCRFDVYKSMLYKGVKLAEAEITRWYVSSEEVQHG